MSNCDFYQRLISDRCDIELSSTLSDQLGLHVATCSSCQEFELSVSYQQDLIRGLPLLRPNTPESLATSRPRKRQVPIWRRRISVPMPLAAGVVLAVIGWAVAGRVQEDAAPKHDTSVQQSSVGSVRFVQIERLEPVAARKIEQGKQTN